MNKNLSKLSLLASLLAFVCSGMLFADDQPGAGPAPAAGDSGAKDLSGGGTTLPDAAAAKPKKKRKRKKKKKAGTDDGAAPAPAPAEPGSPPMAN